MTCTLGTLCLFLTFTASPGAVAPAPGMAGILSGPVEGAPVKNYGNVDEGFLSRSGRPTMEGYAWLRQQGVKGIVNLTTEDVGQSFLKGLGFEYYLWLPMQGPPSDGQAQRFLWYVEDPVKWPLHVHCDSGKDRTGVLVALIRYAIDGWPLEKALEEARLYRLQGLFPEYIEWLTRWAEHHPPGSHGPAGRGGKNDGR